MRIHGRTGVAYLSLLSGAAASPAAFLSGWSLDFTKTVIDTTVITDAQHSWMASFSDPSGEFTGFFDTATAQAYAAAVDGQPRNLFIYPTAAQPGQFFSGQVIADYRVGGGTAGAVSLAVTWAAAGPFAGLGIGVPGVPPTGGQSAVPGLAIPGQARVAHPS